MDHINFRIFTLKKNGTISTSNRTATVSYPESREEAILAEINMTSEAKGFI